MFRAVILLAAIVYLTSTMASFQAPKIPFNTQSQCVEKLCSNNQNECSSASELKRVYDACTRQLDLGCIEQSMQQLTRFDKDENNELTAIARSCQYVTGRVHKIAISKLNRFERDELQEVTRLNSLLWLVENSCLDSALSKLDSWDFDSLEDIGRVMSQCSGTFNPSCFKKQCKNRFDCNDQGEVIDALRKCISGPSLQDRRRL